jgi:thiol-disulfide isomerase/thioredoxin
MTSIILLILTFTLFTGCVQNPNGKDKTQYQAFDDIVYMLENSTKINLNILSNDKNTASVILTNESIVTEPENGTIEIFEDKILYTPTEGFIGNDSFVYKASSGNNKYDTARVTIKVFDRSGEIFNFTLLDSSTKSIIDYREKIILLDFFGVYCTPCQAQMIELDKINQEYKDEDFEIISIDVWIVFGETADLVEDFIQQYANLEEPVYLDWAFGVDDSSGILYFKYAENGVPMLYILDKNGNIYYSKAGYTDYSTLKNKIDELL